MLSPLISIIMPLYNSAEYLKEAIDSILNQTFQEWELIVINELGSEDGSREMVSNYAKIDKRIILLQNDSKLGISASMNRGLALAQGKYIARMDADDISLPNRLEKQFRYMEEHPSIVMCGVRVEIFGTNPFEWELETESEQLATNILFYSPCVHPTIMIRKAFLQENNIKYNEEYRASEDYDLFSQICRCGRIANLDEVLFRYRIMENNATFKNNDIGMVIYCEVMKRQFKELGLDFSSEELHLLSPHYSVKGMKGLEVLKAIDQLSLLLQKIFVANEKSGVYNRNFLWKTLHKRFKEAYDSTEWFCQSYEKYKLDQIYNHSIFSKPDFYVRKGPEVCPDAPLVTVLIPTFNSEDHILGTLWSVLEQSLQDFEILIVNEFGSDDDTVFTIGLFHDARIRIIQNETRLGLAESLNLGFREAKGRYIARMDADDLCHKDRLKLQVEFLDEHTDYGICGSWQHHFGIQTEWIHKCSVTHDDIQAELIFNCDLCHSTLMLRKEYFIANQLYFNPSFAAEDYELWTRAVKCFKIANLPLILGEYRVGSSNITAGKLERLSAESGKMAAKNIEDYFHFKIEESLVPFQSGWENKFEKLSAHERKDKLKAEKKILMKMWTENQKNPVLNSDSLLKTINKRWRFITNTQNEDGEIYPIEQLFEIFDYNSIKNTVRTQRPQKYSLKSLIKYMLRRPYYAFRNRTVGVIQQTLWDMDGHLYDYYAKLQQTSYDMDGHLYDYYSRLAHCCTDINTLSRQASEEQKAAAETALTFLEDITQSFVLLNERLETIEALIKNCNFSDLESRLQQHIENTTMQTNALFEAHNKVLNEVMSDRLSKTEKNISDCLSKQIQASAQEMSEKTDTRVWKAELAINEKTDARIWKAEMSINEKMDARVWKAEQNIVEQQKLLADLLFQFQAYGNKVILLNTPSHDNLGDHAIAYAEKCWLENDMNFHVVDIPGELYRKFHTVIRRFITEQDILAISGGGYLGTLWEYEEALVEQIISEYPNNKIVIFPQSVFFSSDEAGNLALQRANSIFSAHSKLSICVREKISYCFMMEHFPQCNVILSTDMALYLRRQTHTMLRPNIERSGIMICLKSDKESVLSEKERSYIRQYAENLDAHVAKADTVTGYNIDIPDRYIEISKKLNEFASFRLVITDRLHGIIFSVLTNTPCIALGGVSHKNKGICDDLSKLGNVIFVEHAEELAHVSNPFTPQQISDDLDTHISDSLKNVASIFEQH